MTQRSTLSDPFDEVLSRLDSVQGRGNQREAACPAHDDNSPSLSVSRGDSQPVVLHCHAGCSDDEILSALGLSWPELLEDRCTQGEFENAPWKHGEEVSAYKYRDEDGAHVYTVKRYEHPEEPWKSFRPYLPGKQRASLGNQKRVLYRLPRVLEAAEEGSVVFVVEGEKDVHTLEEHGFTATTNGSAGQWKDRYSQRLAGATVVVLPDNDSEGLDHAQNVAEGCYPVADSVRIVELGDVPTKGDVTDWFARGHGADELTQKVEEASTYDPSDDLSPSGDGQAGRPPDAPQSGDEEAPRDEHFWTFDTSSGKIKLDRTAFRRFLIDRGFGKVYAEEDLSAMLVRVQDNIVKRTSRERIKDFTIQHVQSLELDNTDEVVDALLRGANVYFSAPLFEFLPRLDLDFHRDTADSAFFYYRNGFVEIAAEGYELRPYEDLDGVIWEDQIIDREFEKLPGDEVQSSDWYGHLENVAGGNETRTAAISTSLGYLQHGYKDPAVTKAIIFMDESVSDVAEGRTGKSLTAKGLQKTSPTLRVDGRNFSFDSRFSFQEVTLGTQVIDFNDARERFPFDRLFSLITDDFPVERKGQDRVTIPFQDSPKFLLSTNFAIGGSGASFEDRTHQIEFSDYYGTDHTPEDEFGHRLFDGWDESEWARFDNTMVLCVQNYLRYGLVGYDQINVDYRQLKQNTCPEFAEWATGFFDSGREYEKDALWRTFREEYEPDYDDLAKSTFGRWLSEFARIYNLEKSESKRRSEDSRGSRTRYVTLS